MSKLIEYAKIDGKFKGTKNIADFFKTEKNSVAYFLLKDLKKNYLVKLLAYFHIRFKKKYLVLLLRDIAINCISEEALIYWRLNFLTIKVVNNLFLPKKKGLIRSLDYVVRRILFDSRNTSQINLKVLIQESIWKFADHIYYRVWKTNFHNIILNFFTKSGIYLPLVTNHAGIDGLLRINFKWEPFDLKVISFSALDPNASVSKNAVWLYSNQGAFRFCNNVRFFIVTPSVDWSDIILSQLACLISNYLNGVIKLIPVVYYYNNKPYSTNCLFLFIEINELDIKLLK